MNDKRSRRSRLNPDQRVLGSLELQLRNLLQTQRAAEPIIERLRAAYPEVVTPVQIHLLDCDAESLIGLVQRLREALAQE